MQNQQYHNNMPPSNDDEISIIQIILTFWKKRGTIFIYSILSFVIIFGIAGLFYLLQSKNQFTTLDFSLDFPGYSENKYPNGTMFGISDLITTNILNNVYNKNGLKKYLAFNDFMASVHVFSNNKEMYFLDKEYQQKLSDNKIFYADRKLIENEYQQKRKTIKNNEYQLVIDLDKTKIPSVVLYSTSGDILKTWLDESIKIRGIDKYQISLYSKNFIDRSSVDSQDYLVICDQLLTMGKQLDNTIKQIQDIPGSKVLTIEDSSGASYTLADIHNRLDMQIKYELTPLTRYIIQNKISKNKANTITFLKDAINQLILQKNKYNEQLASCQNILKQFNLSASPVTTGSGKEGVNPGPTTQIDSSFLTSIMSLTEKNANLTNTKEIVDKMADISDKLADVNNEIEKYQEQIQLFSENTQAGGGSVEKELSEKQLKILNTILNTIDLLRMFYDKLNTYSLNPQSQYYTTHYFTIETEPSTISSKKLIVASAILWFLFEGILLFIIIIRSKKTGRFPSQS